MGNHAIAIYLVIIVIITTILNTQLCLILRSSGRFPEVAAPTLTHSNLSPNRLSPRRLVEEARETALPIHGSGSTVII